MAYADSIAGQILAEHLVKGKLALGGEIGIRIDQTLTQDATGTLVYLEFMSLGMDRIETDLSVSYADHNTLQAGSENADDHRFLQSAAARYGAAFSRPGNGISHQIHLERFGIPGRTLLGSDSHTPTCGGLGMLAIGAGGMDVATAMAGAPFYMKVPSIVSVQLVGKLPEWVGAKDVILHLLQRLTVKGGVGKIMEYGGPGLTNLSVTERATITNMGAELGAWTSIFPSDETTREFLKSQQRENDWIPVSARESVEYEKVIEVDLAALEPLVACPSSPDAVKPVSEIAGLKVDQVAIGSCTNSSYRDLKLAATLLKGKKVHPEVSLIIAPGSRQVMSILARNGSLADIIDSGARVLENACGPCIGMGQAPPTGGVSIRTFNRNFPGRSGTADAQVYLSGPEIAVAAALNGHLTDPRETGNRPMIEDPDQIAPDDSMIIQPPEDNETVTIQMGPNIIPLPELDPLPGELNVNILLKLGGNITTDDILPGGAKVLPLRSNLPAISKYAFALKAPDFARRAEESGDIAIVGGHNYGQGSSREHAALVPRYLGVCVVLAMSFARLHRANLINFGVLPVLISQEAYDKMEAKQDIAVTGIHKALTENDVTTVTLSGEGFTAEGSLDLSGRECKIILAGGKLNLLKNQNKK
ncbi:MAG: aconitate hydratase [Planctomycetota bacterium]|jgi:aconitate hydratase